MPIVQYTCDESHCSVLEGAHLATSSAQPEMNMHVQAAPPENKTTFRQRYFLCDEHWEKHSDGSRGPIFFYVGNEADVTLYLNATGIMWESAPSFGALLVFAEHRYYGQSKPYGKTLRQHMQFLTSEQAMADYAQLVMELKEEHGAQDSAVIGFGGSYGVQH